MRAARCVFLVAVCFVPTASVLAQPVPSREPSSTHIFPAGGRRGTTVPVLVGGECIPPETRFLIWGDGVTAPALLGPKVQARLEPSPRRMPREMPISYPKEWESNIEIAADAELGSRMWRLSCARGGTGTRPFIVGDRPEFIETESNSLAERAERVDLPLTLNGRIAGEGDLDYFVFAARGGEIVVCDIAAGRLGSPLDPVVEITDSSGRRVAVEELRIGSDPVLAFRAPASGDYRLLVSNVSFHGSPAHVYRITLTAVTDLSASTSSGMLAELLDRGLIRTLATATVREGQSPSNRPAPQRVLSAADVRHLALPATLCGRFETAADEHCFRFRGEKDQAFTFTCRAFPPGLPTLPVVAVLDGDGKLLVECKSVDSPDRECWLDWRAPGSGEYRLRVRDAQYGLRGGTEFGYALSVRPATPDFALRLKSDFDNVMQGAKTELEVKVRRSGGFAGAIEIAAQGLPPGVRAEPVEIAPNQDTAKLVLVADQNAQSADAVLRVVGRANVGDERIERVAVAPHLGRDPEGTSVAPPETERLHLTVQHKPVFRLHCHEAYQYAHRGTVYPYSMQVERLDGFDGPIVIQLGDRQNRDLDGVEFIEVTVPPGQTDVKVPIYFPESMHINVLSQSQIYAQGYAIFTDEWGQRQSTLVVSEKRNMVRTMPTVVKLAATETELAMRPGATVRCKLMLERTSNFTGGMEVELVEPRSAAGFVAEPVRIAPNCDTAEMEVRIPAELNCGDTPLLRFRARGQLSPEVTVVSEATLPVKFE